MHDISAEIDKLLTLLEEAPRRLASMTRGLEPARLQAKRSEEDWSVNEILAHLRVCAEVWGKSMLAMIAQDHPTLRYVSPRTVAKKRNYASQEYGVSLQEFTKQRTELVQSLKSLEKEAWPRGATFTGTTRGRDQTIFSYAQRIANHEADHLDQIAALLATPQLPES